MAGFLGGIFGRKQQHPPRAHSTPADAPPEVTSPKDPSMKLVLIPHGGFWAGAPYIGCGRNDGPNSTFRVEDFHPYYLAETAVTNAQYARFLTEAQPAESDLFLYILLARDHHKHPIVLRDGAYTPEPGTEDYAVQCVSVYGAEAYCQWAGLRLPTELEWEKGARGTDGRMFPWGSEWEQERLRLADENDMARLQPVFSFPEGRSPYGLWSMMGGVMEWCQDGYGESGPVYRRYKRGDLAPERRHLQHVLRGTAASRMAHGEGGIGHQVLVRQGLAGKTHGASTGLRCAMDVPGYEY